MVYFFDPLISQNTDSMEEIVQPSICENDKNLNNSGSETTPAWDIDIRDSSCSWDYESAAKLAANYLLSTEAVYEQSANYSNPPPDVSTSYLETGGSEDSGEQHFSIPVTACSLRYRPSRTLHNPRFRTEFCRNFAEKGTCVYGQMCQFAHGKAELRQEMGKNNKYKTKPCQKYWINGYCAYGPRCNFIHEEHLNQTTQPYADESYSPNYVRNGDGFTVNYDEMSSHQQDGCRENDLHIGTSEGYSNYEVGQYFHPELKESSLLPYLPPHQDVNKGHPVEESGVKHALGQKTNSLSEDSQQNELRVEAALPLNASAPDFNCHAKNATQESNRTDLLGKNVVSRGVVCVQNEIRLPSGYSMTNIPPPVDGGYLLTNQPLNWNKPVKSESMNVAQSSCYVDRSAVPPQASDHFVHMEANNQVTMSDKDFIYQGKDESCPDRFISKFEAPPGQNRHSGLGQLVNRHFVPDYCNRFGETCSRLEYEKEQYGSRSEQVGGYSISSTTNYDLESMGQGISSECTDDGSSSAHSSLSWESGTFRTDQLSTRNHGVRRNSLGESGDSGDSEMGERSSGETCTSFNNNNNNNNNDNHSLHLWGTKLAQQQIMSKAKIASISRSIPHPEDNPLPLSRFSQDFRPDDDDWGFAATAAVMAAADCFRLECSKAEAAAKFKSEYNRATAAAAAKIKPIGSGKPSVVKSSLPTDIMANRRAIRGADQRNWYTNKGDAEGFAATTNSWSLRAGAERFRDSFITS